LIEDEGLHRGFCGRQGRNTLTMEPKLVKSKPGRPPAYRLAPKGKPAPIPRIRVSVWKRLPSALVCDDVPRPLTKMDWDLLPQHGWQFQPARPHHKGRRIVYSYKGRVWYAAMRGPTPPWAFQG